MYITEKLIKSFTEDVFDIVERSKFGYDWWRVYIEPASYGIDVHIYSDNGHTIRESEKMAKKAIQNWDLYCSKLDKYKGYLDEAILNRQVGYSGEGEYDVDYGMDIVLYFEFGDKLKRCSGSGYFDVKSQLMKYLKELSKDNSFPIVDYGNVCHIGKYFDFDYSTKKISPIDRINIYPDEQKKLSGMVGELLNQLGYSGVPIKAVSIDRYIPYYKNLYFYSVGDECLLWNDVMRGFSQQFKDLFEEKEFR